VSAPAALSVADREVRLTTYLVVGALLAGVVLQVWLPPGGMTLVAAAFLTSVLVVALGYVVPGRLRETMASFRFVATLLFVLAVMAMLGTLILQMKPAGFYVSRYGVVGKLIVALRFDDIFHGVPFALLMALFGSSVISSATLRFPVKLRNAGFFICHVGLMTSLAGAAASATLAIRGRIDLFAGGETATQVRVTKAGQPTGEVAQLGFDLRLDRFEAPSYEPEYRVGYYEQGMVTDEHGTHPEWRLKASFDPDLEKHRLPGGDSFRLKGVYPDLRPTPDGAPRHVPYDGASPEWKSPANPAVSIEVQQQGLPKEQLMFARRASPVFLSQTSALVFEKRAEEKRAYISYVTAKPQAGEAVKSVVSVNDPFVFNGWTLYQVNYNPQDPTYSGLDAVYDPGVTWVFTGFALICLGVVYMFYVEPRLKRRSPAAAKS
jgi:cytochrome c biogenesis protein ResB